MMRELLQYVMGDMLTTVLLGSKLLNDDDKVKMVSHTINSNNQKF